MSLLSISAIFLLVATTACTSTPSPTKSHSSVDPSTAVTVETSGDLFLSPDGSSYLVQFFGRCEKNEQKVIVEANSIQSEALCQNFQYRYSHKIPKKEANSENLFWVTKLQFYHPNRKQNQALSWILFDTQKKALKTVVNQQLRFERLPNGDLGPILEFNALGMCQAGSNVQAQITGLDTYQQTVNRYSDTKPCQHGSFYFLSQMEGESLKDFKFEVQELLSVAPKKETAAAEKLPGESRNPASASEQVTVAETPTLDPAPPRVGFQWSIDLE